MNDSRWKLGAVLYRKADTEVGGTLTGLIERPGKVVTYLVSWPEDGEMEHWELELTEERAL